MSGFVYVDCVAGSVCGNMHNAQSKARAGGLYVDFPGIVVLHRLADEQPVDQLLVHCRQFPQIRSNASC